MYEDPIVDEVRKTRERLAQERGFDVGAIFEDLRKRQSKWGTRLVHRQKQSGTEPAAAPGRKPTTPRPGR